MFGELTTTEHKNLQKKASVFNDTEMFSSGVLGVSEKRCSISCQDAERCGFRHFSLTANQTRTMHILMQPPLFIMVIRARALRACTRILLSKYLIRFSIPSTLRRVKGTTRCISRVGAETRYEAFKTRRLWMVQVGIHPAQQSHPHRAAGACSALGQLPCSLGAHVRSRRFVLSNPGERSRVASLDCREVSRFITTRFWA